MTTPISASLITISSSSTQPISNGAIGGIVAGGVIIALIAITGLFYYKLKKLEIQNRSTALPTANADGLYVRDVERPFSSGYTGTNADAPRGNVKNENVLGGRLGE